MRKTRLRKFRNKNKGKIAIAKIILSFYLVLISLNNLTTNTTALFKSDAENKSTFQASWKVTEVWDKSSLTFWNEDTAEKYGTTSEKKNTRESYENHYGFTCEEGIYSDIKNTGETMKGKSLFFVRYVTSGAINKNDPGKIIKEDDIPILQSKEIHKLEYMPNKLTDLRPGVYKFSALQRPLHPGGTENESKEYDGRFEIWGEVSINITEEKLASCQNNKAPKEQQTSNTTSSKSIPQNKTQTRKEVKQATPQKTSKNNSEPTKNEKQAEVTAEPNGKEPEPVKSDQENESKEGEDTK